MKPKLLLSTPLLTPGPMTALRNHRSILQSYYDIELISLEDLISPAWFTSIGQKRLFYRVCKRMKDVPSVSNIVPYGENIIFGTFHPIHEGMIKKLNRLNIRPSFMWCSTLGQMESTPHEMRLFMRLVELLKRGNIKCLFLPRRLFDLAGYIAEEAELLPYSIDLAPYQQIEKSDIPGFNVDLFCRPRAGKNILNQIAAFKMAEINGILHTNFATKQFCGIIEGIGSSIVQHEWIPAGDYLKFVAGMNLSLQVTIGESFNYAVCERMCLGVPVLTTRDIYIVSEDRFLAKYLCIDAPDTPSVIARVIRRIARDHKLALDIAQRSRSRIAEVAEFNNNIVLEQIQKHFS